MNGRQRSFLKGLANNLKPSMQIGKNGISDSLISQLDELLEHHELVKINVLNTTELTKEDIEEILQRTKAEFVQLIGNKFTIYRESEEHKKIELP